MMKKNTLVIAAAALLALTGAAQAFDAQGETTNTAVIKVGGATVVSGPHAQVGAPGIALDGRNYISLQSIDAYTYKDSATVESGVAFRRHQLLGYRHRGEGGMISTDLNWFKLPALSQSVYFGLASQAGAAKSPAAFYVGDRSGYALPSATTSYAAVGYLVAPTKDSSAPVILTGTLQYNTTVGKLATTEGLKGNGYTLTINTDVVASTGTFSGNSKLDRTVPVKGTPVTTPIGSGIASGKFFGAGNTSAVAGTAQSTSGSNYVAAFGGVKK